MVREPIAFLSYVRSDDDHDNGQITQLRLKLEGELKAQTGRIFPIFQDRNDITWGQHWLQRIEGSLLEVTFLIPILTPSFFQSPACRHEFKTFALKERQLGLSKLILPLYYLTSDELERSGVDEIGDVVRDRHWTDWRPHRFKPLTHVDVLEAVAKMASGIRVAIADLSRELDAELANRSDPGAQETPATTPKRATRKGGRRSTAPEAEPVAFVEPTAPFTVEIPQARGKGRYDPAVLEALRSTPYYAYTKVYDEEVDAQDLSTAVELLAYSRTVASVAHDLEIDHSLALPIEKQFSEQRKLSVSLLIDNSGSLRGKEIRFVAAWVTILAEWIERIGAEVEVLGYTTRAWRGGQSRIRWLADGKPARPGRLNDLRHIVYKSFEHPAREAASNFGLMLREGLLKENIDGEALLWAYSRLKARPTRRKLMVLICDGAPVDDATLSTNYGTFLHDHLRFVADHISSDPFVDLLSIGIEHDLTSLIPNSINVPTAHTLGLPIIAELKTALASPGKILK